MSAEGPLAGPLAEFLRALSAAAVAVVDDRGGVVLFNAAAERMFGYEASEVLGRSVEMLLPEGRRMAHADARDAYARAAAPRPLGHGRDLEARRKDGSVFPAEVALDPFRHEGRGYVAACIVDITERKRLERSREDAVSLAAHEIRAPMTSIGLALSMLSGELKTQLPETAARLLGIASRETARLRRLIDDYLDLAKFESGGVRFAQRRVELAPLVRHAVDAAAVLASPEGVRFDAEVEADAAAQADPDRLAQALANLLSNAAKFSPRGGVVSVRVASAGGRVRVSVADQGPGIPPEFRTRIFQRFQQARHQPDAVRVKGTGLGLSIVRVIAERMGGTVGYESEFGRGATFTLDLPAA